MRLINRVLAALLALAVIVVSAVVVIEVVTHWFSKKPALVHWKAWTSSARSTRWNQGNIRFLCIALIIVGLVLLVAELRRARVTRLSADPEQTDAEGIDTAYTRRGVAAAVRAAVLDVDGVRAASVTVGRRKIAVTATSGVRDRSTAQTFRQPVTEAVESRLNGLRLRSTPALSVTVQPRSS